MSEQSAQESITPVSAAVAEHGTSTPSTLREEMVKAAQDAKAASVDAAPAEEKEETEAPAAEAAAAPSDPAPISQVAKALKERRAKEQRRLETQKESQQLEQYRRQAAQQNAAMEQERRSIEAERARLREIQKDPMKVAEYAGWTPEQLAQNLAMQGSPEWQESQRIRAQLDELKSQQAEQKRAWEEHQQQLLRQNQELERREQLSTERRYIETSDKYPSLSKLPPPVRLHWGYQIAREYHAATNQVASDEMIAEYQESSLSGSETGNTREARQQLGGHGKAPTHRANGSRTLSTSMASERRSSPKPVSNNFSSPEERKAELLAALREAKRAAT